MPIKHKTKSQNIKMHLNTQDQALLKCLIAAATQCAEMFIRKNGSVYSSFTAVTPSGLLVVPVGKLSDDAATSSFVSTIRLGCIATAATAGVLSLEAWTASGKPGEHVDLNARQSLSGHNWEGVCLSVEALSGLYIQRFLPILRDKVGRFDGFGPVESLPSEPDAGRYFRFLPVGPPSDKERQAAVEKLRAGAVWVEAGPGSEAPRQNN